METLVAIEGLTDFIKSLDSLPDKQRLAAMRAINKTADRARTRADRQLRREINLSARYVGEKLTVARRANQTHLNAKVTGTSRPISLTRFATTTSYGLEGIPVSVRPGVAKRIRRAFIMPLRGKNGELTNAGFAVRTSGGPPKGAYKPKRISDTLWLLYGPSVDQIFKTLIQSDEKFSADTAAYLETEFIRLTKGDF